MKKYARLWLSILLILIVLCTSCNQSEQGDSTILAQAPADINEYINTIPAWVQGVQKKGELYEGLNLDGVGTADDAVYICPYQFDEYGERITVIFVHLGTGETISKVIPFAGRYEFRTGTLLVEDKEAILLEIGVEGSNYDAVNLFVLNVLPPRTDEQGVFRDPEVTFFLETRNAEILVDENVPKVFLSDLMDQEITNFVEGVSVVDIEDQSLQGISLKTNNSGVLREITIFWDSDSYRWIVCDD